MVSELKCSKCGRPFTVAAVIAGVLMTAINAAIFAVIVFGIGLWMGIL